MTSLLQFDTAKSRHSAPDGEMSDIELLHSISVALIGEQDRMELYGKIVDAAIAITGSQFGTMQLLAQSEEGEGLKLLCSRGLTPETEAFWLWVSPTAHSSCTLALKTGERAIIPDYDQWDQIAGTEDLDAFHLAGIRSAQTTPLLSRNGNLLGMISTHWATPHRPSERDLRLLDILARQAADLLDRTIADEALRAREKALQDSEALLKMLTGELSHRVKNMLATVQAIASQTLRGADTPEDFVRSFGGRIESMSRVHSQLSTNDWKGTQLRDIVRDQMDLGPVDEAQISAAGPDVHVHAADVPKMAMILHELGTNSIKYGALSTTAGKVTIAWTIGARTIDMRWIERGGPKVEAPMRRGFGTRLIEASVRGAGGAARMSADPDGISWDIAFPLPADGSAARPDAEAPVIEPVATAPVRSARSSTLEGKRILVVEDEPLLAMDIAGQLEDAGAEVIGPAADTADALMLIGRYRCDAALLDANLDGEPVDAIAAALTANQVPFAFVTGYGRDSLPAGFADTELLPKPFNAGQLLAAAGKLVA